MDFASGAGGPTAAIEREVNAVIEKEKGDGDGDAAMFVLTDLHPHVEAWERAVKKSANLRFVREGVDASDVGVGVVERAVGENKMKMKKKVMRLFSLAFHHFDDELAEGILRNTIETSDGFAYVYTRSTLLSFHWGFGSIDDIHLANKTSSQNLRAPIPHHLLLHHHLPVWPARRPAHALLLLEPAAPARIHLPHPSHPLLLGL